MFIITSSYVPSRQPCTNNFKKTNTTLVIEDLNSLVVCMSVNRAGQACREGGGEEVSYPGPGFFGRDRFSWCF